MGAEDLRPWVGAYFPITLICMVVYFYGAYGASRKDKMQLLRWCLALWFLPILFCGLVWLGNHLILILIYGPSSVWIGDIYIVPPRDPHRYRISNGDVYSGWQYHIWQFSVFLFMIPEIFAYGWYALGIKYS